MRRPSVGIVVGVGDPRPAGGERLAVNAETFGRHCGRGRRPAPSGWRTACSECGDLRSALWSGSETRAQREAILLCAKAAALQLHLHAKASSRESVSLELGEPAGQITRGDAIRAKHCAILRTRERCLMSFLELLNTAADD